MDPEANIFIVDDDPDITEAIKILLESRSYQATICANGEECFKKLKEVKPDLIILDIMMTWAGEGLEVSRRLKNDPEYRDIPIIMLTAAEKKTGFEFKSESGDEDWLPIDAFLSKPFQPDELLALVDKFLDR